jgi:uncharacterized membrane protein
MQSLISRIWKATREAVRRYFVAGMLAFAPIGITVWAIAWIVGSLDALLLPKLIDLFFPNADTPPDLPPLVGALFTFLVILLSGVIVRHFFGHEIVKLSERILARVPVASSIYAGVKQLFEAILSTSTAQSSFSRVVVIEYPRKGIYGLAFVTGTVRGQLAKKFEGRTMLNCFVPTTPNPTSGFYLLVPVEDVIDVDLSVEEAFKVIMSAGLVTPDMAADSSRY